MALFDDARSAWGARSPKSKPVQVAPSKRTEFFNHYDGGHPLGLAAKPHSACLAQVKADQAFHMDGNGWSDIGYNGLVCPHGRAIEGRGIDAVGAHCPNHNTTGYGLQFMVGGTETPTPAAFARMAKLYADCATRSGHALAKKGHRDGFATACPGDIVQAWVKAGMRSPIAPPVAPSTPAKEWDDMASKDELVGAVWTDPLTTKGTWPYGKDLESPLDILTRLSRNVQSLGSLVKAQDSASEIAAAVVDALPDSNLTARDVAAEIIAQLTPKETP